MSKSDPDSAIFMEDSEQDVNRKIKSAYCPEGDEDFDKNPVIDYIKHIVFGYNGKFEVNEEFKYEDYNKFEEDYKDDHGMPVYKKDDNGNFIVAEVIPIEVPYLKKEVMTLLEHYNKYHSQC